MDNEEGQTGAVYRKKPLEGKSMAIARLIQDILGGGEGSNLFKKKFEDLGSLQT